MTMTYDFENTERFILLVGPGVSAENVWRRLAIVLQKLVVPWYHQN